MKCSGARMKKYEFDKSTTQQYSFNNDLVIWRYADALLLKAEAEYRMGNKAEALTIVNEVRGVNAVRVNVGFHWFDDKHATSYNNRQEKLNTITKPKVDILDDNGILCRSWR